MGPLRLQIDGRVFRDSKKREVNLRGINCAADAKLPSHPNVPSHEPCHFFDGDSVSFKERPFTKDTAHTHFTRLKRFGYNTIRYIFTWEAIEHEGPGKYDEEWIAHTIEILRIAKEYGFYVFLDPHQDVWSRFTGGSGAPMWTLYALGLDPQNFQATEAAIPHNTWPDGPENFPRMVWATNYYRLACQVMFTAFFAGRDFLPRAVLDGKNIQDYLLDHYLGALRQFAKRIHEAGDIEHDVVIGWESWNEPNSGLIGREDISTVPASQPLKNHTSPTPFQSMLLGMGRSCEVDTYAVGSFGPYKTGTQLVDPKGVTAWLPADFDDSRYGWKRDPQWKLGECIWAQHGVWDPSNDTLLKSDYFAKIPSTKTAINEEMWMNHFFLQHWRSFRNAIKSEFSDAIMFCQPTPFEIPPNIKDTDDDTPDLVYAPHFYDGITLMTKKWNRFWSIDILGILRGKYLSPAFAIRVGESAIRNNVRDQLGAMRQEGLDYMGEHPCLFSEIGIPFDMDDKAAYRTGDYTSQTLAMDANQYGLEGSGANGHTIWVYVTNNNHQWGDQWNGEDLSIFSLDDKDLPNHPYPAIDKPSSSGDSAAASTTSLTQKSAKAQIKADVNPSNISRTLSTPPISPIPSITDPDIASGGYRAAEASVRAAPIYTCGRLTAHTFDLRNCLFTMSLECPPEEAPMTRDPKSRNRQQENTSPAGIETSDDGAPTEIFLPDFHFPKDRTTIEVSSGRWHIEMEDPGPMQGQRLLWWHSSGAQNIRVTGVKRRMGVALGKEEEEESYWEACRRSACSIM